MRKATNQKVVILLFSATILTAAYPLLLRAQSTGPEGFVIKEVRFDESVREKKPTPKIPISWRFIGVSNGEKSNSNNLWFQDKKGNIYVVQGFTAYDKFILREDIQKISVGK